MQVHISPDDYLAGVRAGLRPRPVFAVLGLVIVLLALIALALAADSLRRGQGSWSDVLGLLAISYFPAWYWLYLPWKVGRVYAQQQSLRQPFSVDIGEEGLQIQSVNGQGVLTWKNLYRWREAKAVFVLYQSDLLFSLIPKRCFESTAAQDAFRATLARQIGPVNKPRVRP